MICEPCDHGPTVYENYCEHCNGLCPVCSEMGECDTCGREYELASRDGRCGDCGDCSSCCTHTEEETMSKYLIRDWMNNILFNGIEFDSFEEGWDWLYVNHPEPDESSPDWVDGWNDDWFVVEKGYTVTGNKEEE